MSFPYPYLFAGPWHSQCRRTLRGPIKATTQAGTPMTSCAAARRLHQECATLRLERGSASHRRTGR